MDEKRSGRAPLDLHIHDADFVLYLLGKPDYITGKACEDYENITYIAACYEYDDCFVNIEGGFFGAPYPFGMSTERCLKRPCWSTKTISLWFMRLENNLRK